VALLITFLSYGGKEKGVKTTTTTISTTSIVKHERESIPAESNNTTIKIYKPTDVGNGTSMKYISNDRNAYLLKENDILYQLFVEGGRCLVYKWQRNTCRKTIRLQCDYQ
jgi:hypothetical protein